MNVWLWAAFAFTCCQAALLWSCLRSPIMGALVSLQLSSVVLVMTMITLSEGTGRSVFLDLALAPALMALPGGLVFARFMERWG